MRYSHDGCRMLDWKHWRLGLAAEDLANMIAFHWIPAKRRFEEPRFLQQHWGEMQRCGLRDYPYECVSARLPYRNRHAAGRIYRVVARRGLARWQVAALGRDHKWIARL